jgi:CDP-diacylglycerol---glycerol-3-phosphate 3-phosphatidyltransferase
MSKRKTRTHKTQNLSLLAPALIIVVVVLSGGIPILIIMLQTGHVRFAIGTVIGAVCVFLVPGLNRDKNRSDDASRIYKTLGLANAISVFRGAVLALLGGVLFVPEPATLGWMPAIVYTIAVIADYFDGFAARKNGRTTELGAILDVEYDSLGVLLASILVVRFEVAGFWFILIGLARYLFILGMEIRKKLGWELTELKGSLSGRVTAGLMMGYLSAAMCPALPVSFRRVAATVFGVFFFASFLRDWLVVSNVLDRDGPIYRNAERIVERWAVPIVRVLLRAGAIILTVITVISLSRGNSAVVAIVAGLGFLIAIGALPRVSALGLLFCIMFLPAELFSSGMSLDRYDTLFSVVLLLVLFLGSGKWSVSEFETRLFRR